MKSTYALTVVAEREICVSIFIEAYLTHLKIISTVSATSKIQYVVSCLQ